MRLLLTSLSALVDWSVSDLARLARLRGELWIGSFPNGVPMSPRQRPVAFCWPVVGEGEVFS